MVSKQFITNRGLNEFRDWLEGGYDTIQTGIKFIQIGSRYQEVSKQHQ